MATATETMMSDGSRTNLLASFKLHQLFDKSTSITVGLVGLWTLGRGESFQFLEPAAVGKRSEVRALLLDPAGCRTGVGGRMFVLLYFTCLESSVFLNKTFLPRC